MNHLAKFERLNKLLVNDIRLLKRMSKAGLITLHAHTGNKVYWNGRHFKVYYIDDWTKSPTFDFDGKKYSVEYRSGSFFPYVYEKYC